MNDHQNLIDDTLVFDDFAKLLQMGRGFREFLFSAKNFVLVKVGDGKAVFKALLRHGVIVRALSGYKLPEWVRISVGTTEQNRKCIAALREVMAA